MTGRPRVTTHLIMSLEFDVCVIADLHDGFLVLCFAEHIHAADIRADAAGDTGFAVDDRGHITHFFLIKIMGPWP